MSMKLTMALAFAAGGVFAARAGIDDAAWTVADVFADSSRGILADTSAAPFFGKVRVAPSPGELKAIRAKTPHPKGFVGTELVFDDDGGVKGRVTLPDGTDGVFVWKGRSLDLKPGSNGISM